MLAALALVCGPALERGAEPAAAAAAIRTPAGSSAASADSSDSSAASSPATSWDGALAIRPSKIAKAPAARAVDAALVEAAPAGPPGEVGSLGIPLMVLRAYHLAADQLGTEQPSCKLPWWLLAGIGHTESGHAEAGRLTADGTTRGKILGPRLDGGIVGDAVITDTDHGALDGDTVYDRAVGPMQFIPSTWRIWGADGNGDGKADPSNIFDATLAAGRYLCADGRDLSTEAGRQAAVLSYNHSAAYLATVLAWGEAYRDGASAVPDSALPVVSDVTKVRPPRSARPPKPVARPSSSPGSHTPSAHPSQTPTAGAPSSSASTSTSAGSTATPSCSVTSPAPTGSESSTVAVQSATGQAHTGSSSGSATADGSWAPAANGSATGDGSPTATPSGSSRLQSAGTQAVSGQASTAGSSPAESGSASSSAPPSCTP